MAQLATETLIRDLRVVAGEFTATLNEETSAVRAASFARAISLQDKKIDLHQRMFGILEEIRVAPKNDAQRHEIKALLTGMTARAEENKAVLEMGFGSLERLVTRVLGLMRRAAQKDAPNYNAGGAYHRTRNKSLNFQTDKTA